MKRLIVLCLCLAPLTGCSLDDWAYASITHEKQMHQATLAAFADLGSNLTSQHQAMAPEKFDELATLRAEYTALIEAKKEEGDQITSPLNDFLGQMGLLEIAALFGVGIPSGIGLKKYVQSGKSRSADDVKEIKGQLDVLKASIKNT